MGQSESSKDSWARSLALDLRAGFRDAVASGAALALAFAEAVDGWVAWSGPC